MREIPEFWSLLNEADLNIIPQKLRPFLRREQPPASWMQTMAYYAHGYDYAFQRLVMIAITLWPQADYLRMPTFFLARHATELHLKEVIKQYAAMTGDIADTGQDHSLVSLWNRALKQMAPAGWASGDDFTNHCGKLIQHLHDFDSDGQRFRYPQSNAGKPFDYTRIELEALAKAHAYITIWCDGVIDMLDASRE